MKRIAITVLLSLLIVGCSTIQSYQAGESGWQELAASSCQDLQLAGTAASAAAAWSKIYFPDHEAVFQTTIEPLLCQIVAGVDAYCAATDLTQDVTSFASLLERKTQLMTLVDRLAALLMAVKGQ